MKSALIKGGLQLVELPVAAGEARQVNTNKNNIWIYDRSGSMWNHLSNVIADACERVLALPSGDTLTIAWFSGEGDFGYIVKGFRIGADNDRKAAIDMLRRNASARNTTCFSEVLADQETVIADLGAINPNFALMFFTDGYPVVSNYGREISSIEAAIKRIAGRINSTLLVGYGDFYNRELMSAMAQEFGGALVHSSNLRTFSLAFEKFVKESAGMQQRVAIKVPPFKQEILAAFSIQGSQITVYPTDEAEILYAPTGENDSIYFLTLNLIEPHKTVTLAGDGWVDLITLERGAYAAAFVMSQRMRADIALDILGALGDVALIDAVNNAFTNEEAGNAEEAVKDAALSPTARLVRGRNTKYLPDPFAFCVLDALDLLADDPDARFHPQHDAFTYKRIGRGAKTLEGYPKFQADEDASSPLDTVTWHDEKLNASVLVTTPGKVALIGDYFAHGFGPEYRCVRMNNYAIIANGILNVAALPVSLSAESFNRLRIAGVIDAETYRPGEIYVVHLNRLPIINRGMADGRTSAQALCRSVWGAVQIEGKLKALKHIRNELDPAKTIARKTNLTPEQEAYLLENGITATGIYSPKTEREPATDFYLAKHFQVKAKGFSSFPKIEEVRQRFKDGKSMTPSGEVVLQGLAMFEAGAPKTSVRDQLLWLDDQIAAMNARLRAGRRDTQRTKFAVLLSKRWFDEFKSRDDNKITVEDVEFTITVVEKKVEI